MIGSSDIYRLIMGSKPASTPYWQQVLLLLLSLLALLLGAYYIYVFAQFMRFTGLSSADIPDDPPWLVPIRTEYLLGVFLLTFLLNKGVYLVHLRRNAHIPSDVKSRWNIGMIMGSMLVNPFYWLRHIWKKPRK